jgi:hypothetical protein
MTQNLETADRIVKLTLALLITILYFLQFIQGPFAETLLVLSLLTMGINVIKTIFHNSQ